MAGSRITLIKSRMPSVGDLNEELMWFCDSLGLFGNRDKDKSCFRMFIILLKSLKTDEELSSDEIAEKINLSRGTVVHHLRKLIDNGLVVTRNNKYSLRVDNLKEMMDEVERDLIKTISNLKKTAVEIDKKLEL
ncbi:MAG: helix-turn-helix domain-containing protein [archaeon]